MATTKNKTDGSKSSESKGASKKAGPKKGKAGAAADEAPDPRAPIELNAKSLEATITAIEAIVAKLPRPAEPVAGDLVDALLHCVLGERMPCGVGQEALRRFAVEFVDRNEFRVTEAFEAEQLLDDLGIPDLFERCRAIQAVVNQIYGDQNKVALDHLREAALSERKNFFQRVPAIPTSAVRFLNDFLAWEEIAFSPRSTQRVQQRLGLDPKRKGDESFIDRLRAALAPFGHIPLQVGPDRADGKPLLEPALSPAWLLVRLTPNTKS